MRAGLGFVRQVGVASDVAGAELAAELAEGEADAVAVGERRGRVDLQLGQRELGSVQVHAELGGLFVELRGVGEVLELTSAAGAEVRTGRCGVRGRGGDFGIEADCRVHGSSW